MKLSKRSILEVSLIAAIAVVLVVSMYSVSGEDKVQSNGAILIVDNVTQTTNETVEVGIRLENYTGKLAQTSFWLKFDPAIVEYKGYNETLSVYGYSYTKTQDETAAEYGVMKVVVEHTNPPELTDPTLICIKLKGNRTDGSVAWINITKVEVLKNSDGTDISYTTINGTFTTLDEVPPAITFDVSEGAKIAGPDISVNATLYDLSGINASSIAVKINDSSITNYSLIPINATTTIVNINPTISALPAAKKITVSASDNSSQHNQASNSVNVTVVESGFTIVHPVSDAIINEPRPEIKVYYTQVNTSTIKMLLNGSQVTPTIDDTNKTVTYTPNFDLPDKSHTVKVEGNSSLTGELVSKEWNFTVDTTPPEILYLGVSDSDGDGFNESGEELTIAWNISDTHFDYIVVNDSTHNVTKYLSNSSINNWSSVYGNQEVTFKAVDKAGNSHETTFHVYNNYVAYITTTKSLSFGGIDLNKTAVMDLMNLSVSRVEFFGGRQIAAPTVSSINRTFITGGTLPLDTTVVVDNNANAPITNTYDSLTVYNPGTNLNFTITAPSVNRANVVLVQANSSRVDEFIDGKPLNLTTFKDLLINIKDNKTEYVGDVYFFGPQGYAKIRIKADGTIGSYTAYNFSVYPSNITKTLEENEVNLSQGFSAPYLANNPITLSSGEYELIALSLDRERTGLVATMPLIVVNSTETGTVSPASKTVQKGQSLSVSFTDADHTAAVLVRNVAYGINAELNVSADNLYIGRLDFTSAGAASQTSKKLSYTRGGKTYNLSASFPEGYAAVGVSSGNSTSINTSSLVPGDYILYTVSEKDKKVEAIGRHDITIIPPSLTIFNVTISTTSHSADISWETNKDATCSIDYGKTPTYGMHKAVPTNLRSHSITLENLDAGVTYYYKIHAVNTINASDIFDYLGNFTTNSTHTELIVNQTNISINATETADIEIQANLSTNTNGSVNITVSQNATNVNASAIAVAGEGVVKYYSIDVSQSIQNNLSYAIIKLYYTIGELDKNGDGDADDVGDIDESKLKLYWYDAGNDTWKELRTGLDLSSIGGPIVYELTLNTADAKGYAGYFLYNTSHFSVYGLGGTIISAAPTPTPYYRALGGGAAAAPINVPVDPTTGAATSTTTLTVDGATLTIPEGTIVKDAEGNPLSTSITMLYTPATAERIGAIAAYDFGPSGTTFSPPIDLVVAYDPADIPAGYSESDLVIKMYDGTAWIDLPTTVDTVAHTATAKVSHFTIFALFAAPPVAPPPTPTPTPSPTIPAVTPTPTPTPPVVPPKVPLALIIGIVIAVIVIGVVAYYFYTKKT